MPLDINYLSNSIRRIRYNKYMQWAKKIKEENDITWRVFIIDVLNLPFSTRKRRLLEGTHSSFDSETLELFNALEDIYRKDITCENKDKAEPYDPFISHIRNQRSRLKRQPVDEKIVNWAKKIKDQNHITWNTFIERVLHLSPSYYKQEVLTRVVKTYSPEKVEDRELIDALWKIYNRDVTIDVDHNTMNKEDMVSDFFSTSREFNFQLYGILRMEYDSSIGKVNFGLSQDNCINNNGVFEPTESMKEIMDNVFPRLIKKKYNLKTWDVPHCHSIWKLLSNTLCI
jgi:hypothetical protein